MLISDSGRESILKSVLGKEGLSGMILFEQEMKAKLEKKSAKPADFNMAQAKKLQI